MVPVLFLLLLAIEPTLADAAKALDAGRAAEVRAALERIVTQTPTQSEAWALLARAHWQLGEPVKASAAARRADLPNAVPGALHALALYYAQSGNRKRAADLEGRYAASGQADAFAAARAALLHSEVGNVDEAIRYGEMADRFQTRPEVILMLARAFEARKDSTKALARYDQLVRMRPDDAESYSQAGQAHLRAASFASAVTLLEQGVSRFSGNAQLQLALGVAYYAQRRFQDAGQRFLQTIQIDPSIEQPYTFLARMIDQLEPLWPAIEPLLVKWNENAPRSHLPPFVLARLVHARGDATGRAESLLRESLRRAPDFWESHFELGGILEQRRQWAEAAAEYEASARLAPAQAEPHYRLGRVYARLGQHQKAAQARATHQRLSTAVAGAGMADRPYNR